MEEKTKTELLEEIDWLKKRLGELEQAGKKKLAGISKDISRHEALESRLREKNKEMNTFIYRASHDLRGPLASILGLVTVAELEVKDEAALRYLQMISKTGNRLDNGLRELLRTISLNEIEPEYSPVDIEGLLEESLLSLKDIEGFKDLDFEVEVQVDGELLNDPRLLKPIFTNILQNSIHFRDKQKHPGRVCVEVQSQNGSGLVLDFRDFGVGMPATVRERAFEMFYKGSLEHDGHGLGLYIVRTAVEKLGGRIKLESEPGKGTRIKIRLPGKNGSGE